MLVGWCGSIDCVEDCRYCGLFYDYDEEGGDEDDGILQESDDCD
ncbi:MAG: hypothetical protein QXN01_04580 [Candidatus Anstonellales archaeon]